MKDQILKVGKIEKIVEKACFRFIVILFITYGFNEYSVVAQV